MQDSLHYRLAFEISSTDIPAQLGITLLFFEEKKEKKERTKEI